MLLPFQQYFFTSTDTLREFYRKFQLMMDQRTPASRRTGLMKRGDAAIGKRFSGTMQGSRFQVIQHKTNGDEDLSSIQGQITGMDHHLKITIQTRFTSSYLIQLIGSVVVVIVAVYMYGAIGVNVLKAPFNTGFMVYLIALLLTVWINMKRYSQKMTILLEELMEFLELSEED